MDEKEPISVGRLNSLFEFNLLIENKTNDKLISPAEDTSLTIEKFQLPNNAHIVITSKHDVVKSDIYTDYIIENSSYILNSLQKRSLNVSSILDIGAGRGTLSVAFGKLFPESNITAVDMNPNSLSACLHNLEQNQMNTNRFTFICDSGISAISKKDFFDLVFITIPTVVVPPKLSNEFKKDLFIETLLSGGVNGRIYLDEILHSISSNMSLNGTMYISIASYINESEVLNILTSKGFNTRIIDRQNRFLHETSYTKHVASFIESYLGYSFPHRNGEKYFEILIIEAVKKRNTNSNF